MPVLQVRNLDVSYGSVQVLFDCALDVHQGEVLACSAQNGAGKSTLLRADQGWPCPTAGVVRLDGRTITYPAPSTGSARGSSQVRGGDGVFPGLSRGGTTRAVRRPPPTCRPERPSAGALRSTIFPVWAAGSSRAGEPVRRPAADARPRPGRSCTTPRSCIIDELSLGLAPIVVQQLIEVVERLKERGQTMMIVEHRQLALELATGRVFMEKGQVRFEGPAQELRRRDDLVEAVFLGAGEGDAGGPCSRWPRCADMDRGGPVQRRSARPEVRRVSPPASC